MWLALIEQAALVSDGACADHAMCRSILSQMDPGQCCWA